jgi:7-carboxy-7-deazaguanine synthase
LSFKVNEIFYSIQGESSYSGYPCVFIRLSGCNLRCSYCDTRYAYDEGAEMEVPLIMKQVEAYHCPLVEITGGEPLIQEETPHLVRFLLDKGYRVLLETNGTQDISRVDPRCIRIMDIKGPSSGEMQKADFKNLERLTEKDEIKFILGDRVDYDYALEILKRIPPVSSVHFSPLFDKMPYPKLAEWILEDHLTVRLHLQLHKLIWPLETRGV